MEEIEKIYKMLETNYKKLQEHTHTHAHTHTHTHTHTHIYIYIHAILITKADLTNEILKKSKNK